MQRGRVIEKIIGDFGSRFFMRDFVFWDLTYLSGGKRKAHAADLLLVLNGECIVISVKGTDGETKSPDRLKLWLKGKAWDASKSAKMGIQRLAKLPFQARNLWDEIREFPAGSLTPICGIGLLECSQEPFAPIDFEITSPDCAVPIHVLSVNDFLNVAQWLGSIWDVFDYFRRREVIRPTFTGINQERPALAYYTLRAKDLDDFPSEDKASLSEFHQLHLLDNLDKYAERDRLAGYVNAVVHELHTRHPDMESFTPPELLRYKESSSERDGYREIAAILNALPMSNKAHIGRQVHAMLQDLRGSRFREARVLCVAATLRKAGLRASQD